MLTTDTGLSERYRGYFEGVGKSPEQVDIEWRALTGETAASISVVKPATVANGSIRILNPEALKSLNENLSSLTHGKTLATFIPAAGAATRFSQLLAVIVNHPLLAQCNTYQEVCGVRDSLNVNNQDHKQLKSILDEELNPFWEQGIREAKFPFFKDLQAKASEGGSDLEGLFKGGKLRQIASLIYDGLSYKNLPKLVIPFHYYPEEQSARTPMEEHMREAVIIQRGCSKINVHFVISEEHREVVDETLTGILNKPSFVSFLAANGLTTNSLKVDFSYQDPSTDAISLDVRTKRLVTDENGDPVLRKAGHGALLPNLSKLPHGGIWVSNVDSTLYDYQPFKNMVCEYKQAMASLSFFHLGELHYLKSRLSSSSDDNEGRELEKNITNYLAENFSFKIAADSLAEMTWTQRKKFLLGILDRPVVVAGFVPLADGLSGGGPFIVENEVDGVTVQSPTILEAAEFKGYTGEAPQFFNPVMMFIAREKQGGSLMDLVKCRDNTRFFVSGKTDKEGNEIRIYELPGLWNGGLAGALFCNVALPSNCFAAAKTLSGKESLLGPLHQGDNKIGKFTELDRQRGIAQ